MRAMRGIGNDTVTTRALYDDYTGVDRDDLGDLRAFGDNQEALKGGPVGTDVLDAAATACTARRHAVDQARPGRGTWMRVTSRGRGRG